MSAMDAMMSMNLSDIADLNNKSADYCCIVSGISETMSLMQISIWLKIAKH